MPWLPLLSDNSVVADESVGGGSAGAGRSLTVSKSFRGRGAMVYLRLKGAKNNGKLGITRNGMCKRRRERKEKWNKGEGDGKKKVKWKDDNAKMDWMIGKKGKNCVIGERSSPPKQMELSGKVIWKGTGGGEEQ